MCYIKSVVNRYYKNYVYTSIPTIIINSKIKNIHLPSCNNCIYYQKEISSSSNILNFCKKFGIKDIVSGKINYADASISRNDENMCGLNGKYFITKIYNKIDNYNPLNECEK